MTLINNKFVPVAILLGSFAIPTTVFWVLLGNPIFLIAICACVLIIPYAFLISKLVKEDRPAINILSGIAAYLFTFIIIISIPLLEVFGLINLPDKYSRVGNILEIAAGVQTNVILIAVFCGVYFTLKRLFKASQ